VVGVISAIAVLGVVAKKHVANEPTRVTVAGSAFVAIIIYKPNLSDNKPEFRSVRDDAAACIAGSRPQPGNSNRRTSS